MTMIPAVRLRDGVRVPQLGFGVFQVPPEDTQRVVEEAPAAGCRHIDTAAAYRNERGVGAAIAASGIAREEVFVTTKLWNSQQGRDQAREAFAKSLDRLGMDHVDLYLIHWPVPSQDRFVEAWRAFGEFREDGRARTVGVSNFRGEDLERLEREADTMPTVNQVELHPRFQQAELRAWHEEHGVATEAWSPLGQGGALGEAAIAEIAERQGRTPAQVVIRWQLQLGNVVIPKSATPEPIHENIDVLGFELSEEDMAEIAELDTGRRYGPDPATFVSP
ncbi:MAG: aldo/keto reductase [Solirubrobacterales bacterium]